MTIRMASQEARRHFSEVLDRAHLDGDTVILEQSGKPMAAVVPLALHERMVAERDSHFGVLDRIRDRVPVLPAEEVARDFAEAVNAARTGAAAQ
ncbi:MAG: type II toxin-antitoxin system Phd/YefM family antitoxin [Gemmatimonadota bacterium]|nr:type II toxin-antitoxin system Phd/YefM family antitoxin [Gemmatimonadota bacterium]